MMADLSKDACTIVQAIGRALRLYLNKIAIFIDLCDEHLKYSGPFYHERLDIYKAESIKVDSKDPNIRSLVNGNYKLVVFFYNFFNGFYVGFKFHLCGFLQFLQFLLLVFHQNLLHLDYLMKKNHSSY